MSSARTFLSRILAPTAAVWHHGHTAAPAYRFCGITHERMTSQPWRQDLPRLPLAYRT
jgi:hypothetical protein